MLVKKSQSSNYIFVNEFMLDDYKIPRNAENVLERITLAQMAELNRFDTPNVPLPSSPSRCSIAGWRSV